MNRQREGVVGAGIFKRDAAPGEKLMNPTELYARTEAVPRYA
jgi:hypothetical protein